jgi:hypothetical protein
MKSLPPSGRGVLVVVLASVTLMGGAAALLGACGPFMDVAADSFCPLVLEIFYVGITTGTTPTTFDPVSQVSRLQMAAFLSRTVDRTLQRGSRRAALGQFWSTRATGLTLTTVGANPTFLRSDGLDVWVSNNSDQTIMRLRGSDGKILETWTSTSTTGAVLAAMGQIFISGLFNPGRLLLIDPRKPAGATLTVSSSLGIFPEGLTFDGGRVWSANANLDETSGGSVSIVTPGSSIPWTTTTVTTGFLTPAGAIYDGTNVWVTDSAAGTLLKLDANAGILQTVTVGINPLYPVFDGSNIWVPNKGSATVTVVRASTGAILQTLNANGLNEPFEAAFDGQRILVTNYSGNSVSLWKAADLTPIGSVVTGGFPAGACSDGANFWIALQAGKVARF